MAKLSPVWERSSSAPRFWVLPTLMVPTLSLPGLAFASFRRSARVRYGEAAFTAMARSKLPIAEIGAKSLSGSNGSVLNSGTLIAVPLVTSASV